MTPMELVSKWRNVDSELKERGYGTTPVGTTHRICADELEKTLNNMSTTFKEVMDDLNKVPPYPSHIFVLEGGAIVDSGHRPRITMTKDRIRIGCSEITLEAAKWLLAKHESLFANKTMVVQ